MKQSESPSNGGLILESNLGIHSFIKSIKKSWYRRRVNEKCRLSGGLTPNYHEMGALQLINQ
jgi:hypothetical protein